MMIGLNDRQQMRDRPIQSGPPGASTHDNAAAAGAAGGRACAGRSRCAGCGASGVGSAVDRRNGAAKAAAGLRTYEFRTDEWAEHYTRRIDATVAALKSAGVPVFWVGLPSIRGPKSTSEMLYLNDLFRTRVEKAGVTYIDIWDGFVDESGRFAVQGPDFEGQIRRLRVSDGVHFTKSGARKLAHYLEREVRRVMQRGTEPAVAPLPVEPQVPAPRGPGAATARPLSGPVVPLTAQATANQDLLGGGCRNRPPPFRAPSPACWSRASRSRRRPAAATTSAGLAAASRPSAPIPTVATTTDPVPAAAAPATPAPAIASVSRPDAKVDNKANAAGSKKTTARAQQPQQAQRQVRPQQQRPRRERDGFNDNFGGGFQGFGR